MECQETSCAKCTIHCEKPTCSVRCPKDMCEKDSCPKCETVCTPAVCHTTCTAPEPQCSPVCEETNCDWKCTKPESCPKPKCELACEKTGCSSGNSAVGGSNAIGKCCPCNDQNNVKNAIVSAGNNPNAMSFLETMSTMLHKIQSGAELCCPCA